MKYVFTGRLRLGGMEWTPELIITLTELWREGVSTAEIGRRMGLSKNAVVGKAHRLNLPGRTSPIIRNGAAPKCVTRAPKTTLSTILAGGQEKRAETVPADAPALALAAPSTVFKPRAPSACNYPMWRNNQRPTHVYCDQPATARGYCERHHADCFENAQPRRAERVETTRG